MRTFIVLISSIVANHFGLLNSWYLVVVVTFLAAIAFVQDLAEINRD